MRRETPKISLVPPTSSTRVTPGNSDVCAASAHEASADLCRQPRGRAGHSLRPDVESVRGRKLVFHSCTPEGLHAASPRDRLALAARDPLRWMRPTPVYGHGTRHRVPSATSGD